ncbi:MAG: hypothetical protein Q7S61_04585 [bacterium]|nr:hypothetical protein [bacterium]
MTDSETRNIASGGVDSSFAHHKPPTKSHLSGAKSIGLALILLGSTAIGYKIGQQPGGIEGVLETGKNLLQGENKGIHPGKDYSEELAYRFSYVPAAIQEAGSSTDRDLFLTREFDGSFRLKTHYNFKDDISIVENPAVLDIHGRNFLRGDISADGKTIMLAYTIDNQTMHAFYHYENGKVKDVKLIEYGNATSNTFMGPYGTGYTIRDDGVFSTFQGKAGRRYVDPYFTDLGLLGDKITQKDISIKPPTEWNIAFLGRDDVFVTDGTMVKTDDGKLHPTIALHRILDGDKLITKVYNTDYFGKDVTNIKISGTSILRADKRDLDFFIDFTITYADGSTKLQGVPASSFR